LKVRLGTLSAFDELHDPPRDPLERCIVKATVGRGIDLSGDLTDMDVH
jgi:hypothetical protein